MTKWDVPVNFEAEGDDGIQVVRDAIQNGIDALKKEPGNEKEIDILASAFYNEPSEIK